MFALADGTTRCLPSPIAYIGTYFSDSGCSNAIAYAVACESPKYAQQTTTTCGNTPSYFAIGGQLSPTQIWLKSGTTCVNENATYIQALEAAGYTFWSPGSAVDISAFATATLQMQ
jgi:hypothetical protein